MQQIGSCQYTPSLWFHGGCRLFYVCPPLFTDVMRLSLFKSFCDLDQQVTLRPVPLLSMLPINLNNYYRYEGSLTIPPCTESVSWTVFSESIEISSRQVNYFLVLSVNWFRTLFMYSLHKYLNVFVNWHKTGLWFNVID